MPPPKKKEKGNKNHTKCNSLVVMIKREKKVLQPHLQTKNSPVEPKKAHNFPPKAKIKM